MYKTLPILAASLLALASCNQKTEQYDASSLDSAAMSAISEESYRNYVAELSSDDFLGRKPFTKGDTLAVQYIEKQFKALGLAPGNGDSYFQEVPMVQIDAKPTNTTWTFSGPKGQVNAKYLDDFVISTPQMNEKVQVADSELVFVGFGIVAPEFDWNDYAGVDVKGKTVVAMVSDPGRYDKNLFKADTMTYYGRWNYKYEEAARQGAAGVILIHETAAASYGWNVVRSGWSGPQLSLVPSADAQNVQFQGWVTTPVANQLFAISDVDASIMEEAKKPGFKARAMGVTTGVDLQSKIRKSASNNVVAQLKGTKRPDEVVIYTAHWDHLGVGEAVDADSIFNGAIDNAAGVSALFEIAKAFQAAKVKPERTIVFMAVTAEEEGLLGSQYYTEHPIFPINKTVGNLNMDAFNAVGATKGVSIVGRGQTELEDYVERSAAKFDRIIVDAGNPSSGGFYRSDHFNFVKMGVPGLFMGSGGDYLETDSVALNKRKEALAGTYHTVADEYNENWDFSGILADIRLFFDIGYTLSMEKVFPNFKAKSEFKELGDKRLSK
ncbi:M28 family metallopeptidase [Sphingobacterium corticibacter]|uniref:Peptidase M28 n=1 Tax=Sphingobacterium corticibacter TaxID=2171749 RepID=A0A2T8HLW4_9SPHI|nr:M28 family metallopeptidase [Sphingobacterium corticibacter]PVH26380.1 peptidase M28 [Sphingobacterium corticibacter]